MKDWDAAEKDLLDLQKNRFGDAGQVEFYLAQVTLHLVGQDLT